MKVLLVNKFFYLNGGAERVFFQNRDFLLANNMSIADFSMTDASNVDSPDKEYFVSHVDFRTTQGGLQKIRNLFSFIHSAEAVRKISTLIDQRKPDIAHLHNIYHQLTPSIIPVLKKKGIKVVLTLHDGKLICPAYLMSNHGRPCISCNGKRFYLPLTSNCQGSRLQGALLAAEAYFHFYRRSYDMVDLFVAPSRFLANLVSHRISSEKIEVLHNGIDPISHVPSWQDHNYVLYFGRLSGEKGIKTLLAASALIGCNVPVKIVGSGPLEEELYCNKADNVEFLGYKSGEELYALIKSASCVVVPSECYENCSMVVLEAMAYGKPVIASRMGGLPEQIEEGGTGRLFPARDVEALAAAIREVMADPVKRLEMGKAARRKLEKEYSLEKHNTRLLEIYRELLE